MSEIVLTDAFVEINSQDLSDHVRSVTINYGAEIKDKTAMGLGSRSKLPGLKDWSVDLEFNQDYALNEVDATLFSLVGAAEFAIIIRSDSGTIDATNPEFTGSALLESYTPLGGSVGDEHITTITLQGTGDLARATA